VKGRGLCVSPPIRQALADDAFEGCIGAHGIVPALGLASVLGAAVSAGNAAGPADGLKAELLHVCSSLYSITL
jgi:hypothetical protein